MAPTTQWFAELINIDHLWTTVLKHGFNLLMPINMS